MYLFQERGRTIATYLVMGVLLALVVGLIAYGVSLLVKTALESMSTVHREGLRALNKTDIEEVGVQVGNETVAITKPSNPVLRSHFDLVLKVLAVVVAVLTNPLTLAILIALTLVAYALMERRE
jgi:hypothetical protein